jgi:hypothetical protein
MIATLLRHFLSENHRGGVRHRIQKPPIPTTLGGTVALPIDLTAPPFSGGASQITAGSTWRFQFWFRDPQGGPAGFNTSDAMRVTFCP